MNDLMTDGHYRVAQNTNLPAILQFGQVIVAKGSYSDTVTQIGVGCAGSSAATPLCMFRHGISAETIIWSEWQPVATATPPQELALPLAAGVSNITPTDMPSAYSKDQFGRVLLTMQMQLTAASTGTKAVATLPVGYRSKKYLRLHLVNAAGMVEIHISPGGDIVLMGSYPTNTRVVGAVVYDASTGP